jgi:hypothetical protein
MKTKYIQTPYGKKTPELLCKAMDAFEREPELIDALREAKCVLYEAINKRSSKTSLALAWHTVNNAIAKATAVSN